MKKKRYLIIWVICLNLNVFSELSIGVNGGVSSDWLLNYDKNNIIKYEDKNVSYYDFVHLELKHFSNDDNNRSIPALLDGLKPSQRKILYGAFEPLPLVQPVL